MKILMLKDYFYPEKCAGITLSLDLVEGFTAKGWETEVFTPIPCRGIDSEVRKQYKRKKIEKIKGAVIHRYWLPYEKNGVIVRAVRYILQNVIQIIKGIFSKRDIIFLGSTPPTMGIVGTILKKIKKIPFVYNVQDIFPDSLVTSGLTEKGSILWKIGRKIEDCTYRNADKIIVISDKFKQNLLEKGVPTNKIVVVSNWINLDQVKHIERSQNDLYKELGLANEDNVVVYAGNCGISQGVDIIIEAAMILPNIKFVVFGGGSEFDSIKKTVFENGLSNVIVRELLPLDRVSEVYSLGNLAIITCKKGVGTSGLPSKTWSIMACNTPIIASYDLDSDLAKLINKANAGVCVEPENVEALASAIESFFSMNMLLKAEDNIRNLRAYVENNASKDACVKKYIEVIEQLGDI